MSRGLTILKGLPIAAIATSVGNGADLLLTPDPKEVWDRGATGAVIIDIDLAAARRYRVSRLYHR